MKRYTCMNEVMLVEHIDGPLTKLSEVHALLRAVAEEVKGMRHDEKCASLIWIPHYETYPCNCRRGRALALLEVK